MPASSPKKRRVSPPPMSAAVDDDVADDLVPLSVSTYHQRRAADEDDDGYSDEDEDEDGNGDFTFRDPHAEGLSATDEEEEEDDPDDDGVVVLRSGPSTPSRRSGSTSSRPGTPGSAAKRTPSKRKTPTPRKAASAQKAAAASAAAGTGPFVRLTPSDAYFTAASRPLRASTAVFSSLVPPLTHQQSAVLLAKSRPKHADEIADLAHEHEARWDGWEAELDVGFGLLFYGLGSKMALLNAFAEGRLAEKGDVVVVNGLFPRLSVRDVLTSIEASIPEIKLLPPPPSTSPLSSTPLDILAYRIYTYYLPAPSSSTATFQRSQLPLYLVFHSLDAAQALRSAQARSLLGLLASSPRIHFLASTDHLHAGVLFSISEARSRKHVYRDDVDLTSPEAWTGEEIPTSRGYSWLHHDLTTLRPYVTEVSMRTSSARLAAGSASASGGSGGIAATEEGAKHILVAVTGPARRLFKALARHQLGSFDSSQSTNTSNPGMSLGGATPAWAAETAVFFRMCRDGWIAREEVRFRALLAEFRDHRLVLESAVPPAGTGGRAMGGELQDGTAADEGAGSGKANARWLWIPLGKEALERLIEEELADVEG